VVSCRPGSFLGPVYGSQAETQHAIEECALGLPVTIIDLCIINLEGATQCRRVKLAAQAFADSKALNQRKQTVTRYTFGLRQSPAPQD